MECDKLSDLLFIVFVWYEGASFSVLDFTCCPRPVFLLLYIMCNLLLTVISDLSHLTC